MRATLRGLPFLLLVSPLALLANPIEATFIGVNGAEGFGYYVGPYYGSLGQQSVVFDCVDFANDVYFGEQWAANLSPMETVADLAETRYGNLPNALQLYQEAAYLTELYAVDPSYYADIQATIWQLFDPYAPTPSTNYWLNLAEVNYAGGNYTDFFVVTNVGPVNPTGQVQEFLTEITPSMPLFSEENLGYLGDTSPVVSTPEPESIVFIGLGLALPALVFWWQWRRKASRQPTPPG
jgi:hypothetical protein